MKIRFWEDTNIRNAPSTISGSIIGVVRKGVEIEVAAAVQGQVISGNDQWYCDKNGWYYWSGKATEIKAPERDIPVAPGTIPLPSISVPLPVFPTAPPMSGDENIPEGETRLVPPIENLLMVEEGFQASMIATGTPIDIDPVEDTTLPEVTVSDEFETVAEQTPGNKGFIQEKPQAASWQPPNPQKLNWAIRKYRLDQEWWQDRNLTGKNIRIALLSTGIDSGHPDLGNIADWTQLNDSAQPLKDGHGLGTQAAMICAGTGQAVYGVAPEAQLLIAKIGEQDHTIQPEGLIAGLEWALNAKADIVALLVDFPELNPLHTGKMKALVQQALGRDVLLLAPVGNSESKKPESRYPASLEGVFSVGAHDQFGQRCSFSARSYHLDLLAPGEGLLIPGPDMKAGVNSRSVAIAAAFTAGFSALLCQWLRQKGQKSGPDAIFPLLRETAAARRSFNPGEDVEYGYGLLDPISVLKKLDPAYQDASQ
jgi:hypothetical protein